MTWLTILVTDISNSYLCRVLGHCWFTSTTSEELYPIHSPHCSNYRGNNCILPSRVFLLMVMSDPELLTTDLPVNYNLRSTVGIRTGETGVFVQGYGICNWKNGSLSSDCWGEGLRENLGLGCVMWTRSKLRLWENWWWGVVRRAAGREEQGKRCLEDSWWGSDSWPWGPSAVTFFLGQYEWPTVLVLK